MHICFRCHQDGTQASRALPHFIVTTAAAGMADLSVIIDAWNHGASAGDDASALLQELQSRRSHRGLPVINQHLLRYVHCPRYRVLATAFRRATSMQIWARDDKPEAPW